MSRKTTKTPAEVAAELRARADRAEARAAQQEHSDNPVLAPLFTELQKLNKALAIESRKFNGPQSFTRRLEALRLRTAWIQAEQAYHTTLENSMRDAKKQIQAAIEHYSKSLANGQEVTNDDVLQAIASASYEGDPDHENAMNLAETAWRAFNKGDGTEEKSEIAAS